MRSSRRAALAAGAWVLAGLLVAIVVVPAGGASAPEKRRPNLCLDPDERRQHRLKCPDLRMRPPYDLDREKIGGKPVLRAANSIDSVGRGPAELRGKRTGAKTMDAVQRIKQRGGGTSKFDNGAKLYFKAIPGQYRYWKFRDAARFSLWRLDGDGDRIRRVEVGPKQIYCLRDLKRTHKRMDGSPRRRVYPSCSQDPNKRRVTLGTSVGWSDIYPYTYHQNWIELDSIPARGCYSFVHVADPRNGIYELNEKNNAASTVVYLTRSGRWKPHRCRGVRDRALPKRQSTDDSQVHGARGGGGGGPYRGG